MRVLITGGAGCLGTNLIEHWLPGGHEIFVIDNFATGKREALPPMPGLTVVEGTVADRDMVEDAFRRFAPTHVVHAAAVLQKSRRLARGRAQQHRRHDQCRRGGAAGARRAPRLSADGAMLRQAADGADPGRSSARALHQLRHLEGGGRELPVAGRRRSGVAAPRERHRAAPRDRPDTHLLQTAEGRATLLLQRHGPRLSRYGGLPCRRWTGSSRRQPLAHTMSPPAKGMRSRTSSNSSRGISASGWMRRCRSLPPGADDVPIVVLDPSKTTRELGWRPRHDFTATIGRMLAWYDAHGVSDTYTHLRQPEAASMADR